MRSSHTEYSSVLQGYQRQIKYAVRTDFQWTDSIRRQAAFTHWSDCLFISAFSPFHYLTLRCFLIFGKIMRFPAAQTESEMHILSEGDKIV